jgi:hypothetical protein
MTTYVWRDGRFVDKKTGGPMATQHYGVANPYVMSDLPAYVSPLGDGVVEGRAARREHLKRNGCRETDPSEFKPTYINEKFAKKHGKEWDEDGAKAEAARRAKVEAMLGDRR